VIGTVFFTYLIYPSIRWLRGRGLKLGAAIAIVYVTIVAVLAFFLSFVIPPLVAQIKELVIQTPSFVQSAQAYIENPDSPLLRFLPASVRDYLALLPSQIVGLIQQYAATAASGFLGIVLSTVSVLGTVIIVPVLSIYLLLEGDVLSRAAVGLIPPKARPKTLAMLADLDTVIGGFVRGQVLVGATVGTAITIALLLMHVPYGLLIGVMAGVLDVIPYIGAIATFIPAVGLATVSAGWQHGLIVALIFAGVFQAEGQFIAPRIVSESVGLSPLVVIVAVLIGGDLLGIPGMFLAVPVAGMIRVLRHHYIPQKA
jgi:predicted PurR-regulated permease PerM